MMQAQTTGVYPDSEQRIVLFTADPTSDACGKNLIEDNEAQAAALLQSTNKTAVKSGGVVSITETVKCFSLVNNALTFLSTWQFNVEEHDVSEYTQ